MTALASPTYRGVPATFTPSKAVGRFIVSQGKPYLGTARGWRKLDMSMAEALYRHDLELRQRFVRKFLLVLLIVAVLTFLITAVTV